MNVYLVRASQFLQQFCLVVRHMPEKEHIILDVLNKLVSAKCARHNDHYFKFDALFIYYTTLMEISPKLVEHIFDGYLADN